MLIKLQIFIIDINIVIEIEKSKIILKFLQKK